MPNFSREPNTEQPNTMNITPGMIIGVGTDIICGEGLIITTGAIDIGACFTQSLNSLTSALSSGVTTIFGNYFGKYFLKINKFKI